MAAPDVTTLDGAGCADALASSCAALVDAERAQVALVAHWCDLHSASRHMPRGEGLPGAERSLVVAGDGTPPVGEFAAGELGLLLDMTTTGAQGLMRDVLGLRHRHPRLFALVRAGQARFFQARHVVRVARNAGLDLAQARLVDDRVAPFIGQVSWGRIMGLVEAAVIEADPEAAEERRVAAEMQRFVRTGRSSEFGTTMIYARARAGDAIFFLAMCDRIAQILKLRGSLEVAGHADRSPEGLDAAMEMDVLRSEAVGILASPGKALALLRWAEDHAANAAAHAPDDDGDAEVAAQADSETHADADSETHADADTATHADADTATHADADTNNDTRAEVAVAVAAASRSRDLAASNDETEEILSTAEPEFEPEPADRPVIVLDDSLDPEQFRPRAVLYVHLSEESFRQQSRGAARVEGVGPITVEQSVDFLRHCHVTVRPVVDLNDNPSSDRYEVSPLHHEMVVLRDPVETFPWGTTASRGADADHRRAYRSPAHGDPPAGQTCPDNLQPLGRYHHRLKTHGGWACTTPERGVVMWRSPHGHWARVDASGTTYVGRLEGAPMVTQVLASHLELLTGSPQVR